MSHDVLQNQSFDLLCHLSCTVFLSITRCDTSYVTCCMSLHVIQRSDMLNHLSVFPPHINLNWRWQVRYNMWHVSCAILVRNEKWHDVSREKWHDMSSEKWHDMSSFYLLHLLSGKVYLSIAGCGRSYVTCCMSLKVIEKMTYWITCHRFFDTNVETGGDKWDATYDMLVVLYMWEVKSDMLQNNHIFICCVTCLVKCAFQLLEEISHVTCCMSHFNASNKWHAESLVTVSFEHTYKLEVTSEIPPVTC